MLDVETLAKDSKRNFLVIQAQTKDLTHQESLVQVPGVNCLNWVLGHIADSRGPRAGPAGRGAGAG